MSLSITSGQQDATRRSSLYGVVYCLSGTLLSRVSGLESAPIRWATRTFSGGPSGELYEAYLGPPDAITGELAFKLGDESPTFPINLPVRNQAFRHKESLLAALVDEDYAWEGSTATLYVGYLQPGQGPEDLAPGDWTALRKNGQLGSPQDIQTDGFRLPFLSRDSFRRQTLNFDRATRDAWPNIDPGDEGRVIPVVIGAPDSWVRALRVDAGVYGFVNAPILSGTTSGITFQTDFSADRVSGLVGQQVYVHRQDKVLTVTDVTIPDPGDFTDRITLTVSGGNIDFNIPQGALVQEKLTEYKFLLAANPVIDNGPGADQFAGIEAFAFELTDGRIIPIEIRRLANANFETITDANAPYNLTPGTKGWQLFRLLDDDTSDPPGQPPALIPRLNLPSTGAEVVSDDVTITQQPDFTPSISKIQATKANFPDGPGGAAAAFDGSLNTGYSLGAFGGVTFTFPSVTGGIFVDTDTIRSILRITSQGDIDVNAGLTTLANLTGSKDSYTIVLGTPLDFDQDISVVANTAGGGIVYEISVEHELEADLTVDRTTDVAADANIVLATADDVGFDMQPIRAVLVKLDGTHADTELTSRFARSPFASEIEGASPITFQVTRPSHVFMNLQKKYLEDQGGFSGDWVDYEDFIDSAAYSGAHAQYVARDLRLNFVITEPMSWPDLERQLALQCRSHAFYGPGGHQLQFIPTSSEAEASPVEATFRLPGTPNPNARKSGPVLIERTSPSQIINRVELFWGRDWLAASRDEVSDRYRRYLTGSQQTSVDVFGERYDPDGPTLAWAIHDPTVLPSGTTYTSASGQAQDLADFIADRHAFARTRFVFEAAWTVFGLTQGSVIRVAFAAAPDVFRNVVCEVEAIETSPINVERRIITARSLGSAQRGLEPALIWTDLFTETTDTWAGRITGTRDRWENYFGVPEA